MTTTATRGRVDPFDIRPGEDRCAHDMLIFGGRATCGECLQLPEVALFDFVHDHDLVDDSVPAARVRPNLVPVDLTGEASTRCAFHTENYGVAAFCTKARRRGSWLCDEHDDDRIAGAL